jgi:hypothetical protein
MQSPPLAYPGVDGPETPLIIQVQVQALAIETNEKKVTMQNMNEIFFDNIYYN